MKSKKETKYKIELTEGTISLTRGKMGAVLIEKRLHELIFGKNFADLGMELLYGWKGYLDFTDDELINAVYEYFTDPKEIKELLRVQARRLKIDHEKTKKEGLQMLKEIWKENAKTKI